MQLPKEVGSAQTNDANSLPQASHFSLIGEGQCLVSQGLQAAETSIPETIAEWSLTETHSIFTYDEAGRPHPSIPRPSMHQNGLVFLNHSSNARFVSLGVCQKPPFIVIVHLIPTAYSLGVILIMTSLRKELRQHPRFERIDEYPYYLARTEKSEGEKLQ